MLNPVYCNGCGKRLEIPEGYAKSKMRCAECGVFNEIPKEVREAKPLAASQGKAKPAKPQAAPPAQPQAAPEPEGEESDGAYRFMVEPVEEKPPEAKPQPKPKAKKRVSDEEAPREVLIHGTEDDDGKPYHVTGDIATRRCPECEKKSDVRDTVCRHCGYNFETKEKAERVFQTIDRTWEAGWPFQKRLMVFIGLQVVNFVSLVVGIVFGHSGVSLTTAAFSVGLQAFLVGTYEILRLKRTEKGKVTLLHSWRYAFIPGPEDSVRWKEHDSVTITRENEFDPISWAFALILLGYCIVPGVLFWYFVIRPDKFTVSLCKDHGYPETPIFRTANEELAKEIRDVVSDISTLPVQK